jgi:tetrahydrodipicolinate N-succinyltransferase
MTFRAPNPLDNYTKLLHLKEQVIEQKLQLTKLAIQKEEAISSQYYEKASQCRMDEKNLMHLLMEQRMLLIQHQKGLEPTPENLKKQAMCQEILHEISTLDETKTEYQGILQEFRAKLILDCEELTKRKNECIAAHNFAEANVLRDNIQQIGEFLAKYSR